MASADLTYARGRSSRVAAARAAKAKRQKYFVAAGAVLFVLLLVIQVPRTLRMLNPPAAVEQPAAEAVPAPVPGGEVEAPAAGEVLSGERLRRFLSQFELKDPFAQRAVRADTTIPVRPAAAGETDPFAPRSYIRASDGPIPTARPATAAPAEGEGSATPAASRPRFTIVLASIPVHNGRSAAIGTAAGARARGLDGVGVLRSSDYPLLRPGYMVVHSRVFTSRREAERALAYAKTTGYRTAYIRRLR